MIFLFLTFALILVYFSVRSLLGGVAYLAYFREELAKPDTPFTPFASIVAPCKGLDEGLRENLSALLELDYPKYEVIFVVDDKSDPAVSVIEEVSGNATKYAKLIVAEKAVHRSQKVENIREAVKHADPKS